MQEYEIVIGLEVHAQLQTRSKLFCGDATTFGAEPNTHVSAISLGHPGTLPVLNRDAVSLAIKLGLATNCEIAEENFFARKNYFYPDLPKGYQITQHTTPICYNGHLDVETDGKTTRIRINRIHMEEDAGKSTHDLSTGMSLIDYNRAGMPLVEIVTEPDIRSASEAAAFVSLLRTMVRQLGVCDGNMEQGSLRCDVNISVRKTGDQTLGTKAEIKNLNSIRFIKKAIDHEAARLIGLHKAGEVILQQTRGLRESDFTTYAIRTKEDDDDYRYFPEPDLPPFIVSKEQIEQIRASLPPSQKQEKERISKQYNLSEYDAALLSADPELRSFFEEVVGFASAKPAANWCLGPLRNYLITSENSVTECGLKASSLASLIALVENGRINYGIAVNKVFPAMAENPALDLDQYILNEGLEKQDDDATLDTLIDEVLLRFPEKITEYRKGKKGLVSLFVGEVMKLSKGKADAKLLNSKIIEKLNKQ